MTATAEPATHATMSKPMACPEWCSLRAHPNHAGWDSKELDDSGRLVRGHQGPRFGPFISIDLREYSDGTSEVGAMVIGDEDTDIEGQITSHDLRHLALDAAAAAEWLEAHK